MDAGLVSDDAEGLLLIPLGEQVLSSPQLWSPSSGQLCNLQEVHSLQLRFLPGSDSKTYFLVFITKHQRAFWFTERFSTWDEVNILEPSTEIDTFP